MNCERCGSATRMDVHAVISAPGNLEHQISKRALRRKDVQITAVLWETADFVCTNPDCCHAYRGYGNYVTRLKAEVNALRGG